MAQPASVVKGSQERLDEVFTGVSVAFQSRYAPLELEEHVESNDHHFFEVWVGDLLIKEMTRYESAKARLERCLLQDPYFIGGYIDVIFKALFASQCP